MYAFFDIPELNVIPYLLCVVLGTQNCSVWRLIEIRECTILFRYGDPVIHTHTHTHTHITYHSYIDIYIYIYIYIY